MSVDSVNALWQDLERTYRESGGYKLVVTYGDDSQQPRYVPTVFHVRKEVCAVSRGCTEAGMYDQDWRQLPNLLLVDRIDQPRAVVSIARLTDPQLQSVLNAPGESSVLFSSLPDALTEQWLDRKLTNVDECLQEWLDRCVEVYVTRVTIEQMRREMTLEDWESFVAYMPPLLGDVWLTVLAPNSSKAVAVVAELPGFTPSTCRPFLTSEGKFSINGRATLSIAHPQIELVSERQT